MRRWIAFLLLPAFLQADSLMQEEIQHVVVLMMENRSFDNVLAWLYSDVDPPDYFIPEKTDPHYLGLSKDTLVQYANTLKDKAGNLVYSCPPIQGVPSVAGSSFLNSPSNDPNEPFSNVQNQIFKGGTQPTMSGFLQDFASLWSQSEWEERRSDICSIMETYTAKELPVFYELSKRYAVSDLWFSSVPTQTNPNRAFAACGTSEGQIVNGPLGKSLFYSDTIWNRLAEESPQTTWMIFWQSDMIPGVIEGPYTGLNTFNALSRIPDLKNHYQKIDAFHDLARKGRLPDFSFIEPQWTLCVNYSPKKFFVEFSGSDQNLLFGLQGNDYHPPGDMRTAENLLANVYTSLIANPEAWQKTLLIVTFDEHGGIFDHIPPPAATPPDNHFENGFTFDRFGVRVPTLFISPKIKGRGVVRSDSAIPFDHTSLIATILKWKNIDRDKWNMGKRVDAAPTFENIITVATPRHDAILKPTSVTLSGIDPLSVVHMEDTFYIHDQNGNYLTKSQFFFSSHVRLGAAPDKVPLSFVSGQGAVTHGSFLVIQANDPDLGNDNVLGTYVLRPDCMYASNGHGPGEWWTIKSLDNPYVGAPIYYGDRVTLENHIYLDPDQFIPARMTHDDGLIGNFLTTKPITDPDDTYWILEKASL